MSGLVGSAVRIVAVRMARRAGGSRALDAMPLAPAVRPARSIVVVALAARPLITGPLRNLWVVAGALVAWSAVAGAILAVIWSPRLVDGVIAGSIADPVVGGDAADVAITGSLAAAVFAFITGVGGMFTACNIAVFGAVAPMTAQSQSLGTRLGGLLRPIAWLALGAIVVGRLYGAIRV